MPDTSSLASLYLVWATLLAAPPIALGAFILIGRRSPSAQSLTTLWSIVALILILGFSGFGFGFTTQLANYAFGCIAYFAYCILAASCLRIRIVYARLGGLIVTAVPILLGYFFGTIGFMALVWIIIPVSTPPKEMSKELICRITDWGSAVSDSGYDVQLYNNLVLGSIPATRSILYQC